MPAGRIKGTNVMFMLVDKGVTQFMSGSQRTGTSLYPWLLKESILRNSVFSGMKQPKKSSKGYVPSG